jgi:hypothetical protein
MEAPQISAFHGNQGSMSGGMIAAAKKSEHHMKFCCTGLRHAALALLAATLPQVSNATVVKVETVVGTFEVNLYDNATPETIPIP